MGGAAKKQVKYSYLPFGAGKRSCIGGAMSQVENTLALSLLLRRFRPEYVGNDPAGINATVTLTPKGGLQVQDPRAQLASKGTAAHFGLAFLRPPPSSISAIFRARSCCVYGLLNSCTPGSSRPWCTIALRV